MLSRIGARAENDARFHGTKAAVNPKKVTRDVARTAGWFVLSGGGVSLALLGFGRAMIGGPASGLLMILVDLFLPARRRGGRRNVPVREYTGPVGGPWEGPFSGTAWMARVVGACP